MSTDTVKVNPTNHKAYDMSIILGTDAGIIKRGLLCHNQSVKDYITHRLYWMGTWQHDTLWCGNRDADIVIEHLINAGFEVE